MSSSNVMPSAHPEQLYPELLPNNFRLIRTCEIQKEISDEIENYRKVAKKYKKVQTVAHYVTVGLGSLSATLLTSGIALSLTGPGIIVCAPLGLVGAFCRAGSVGSTISLSRKLCLKVTKRKNYSLAVSKRLNEGVVTDTEVQIINSELEQYFLLKEAVRNKLKEKNKPWTRFRKN